MKLSSLFLYLLLSTSICYSQESHLINTQDGALHYQVFGDGQPILIINGGPGFNSEGFKNIAMDIASFGYKSILFDQRGTGKSTLEVINSSSITMHKMAHDMELIREDMGIDNWFLLGHSFGGMLANYYTTLYPNRVSAIIHSSSGGLDLHLMDNAQSNLYSRLTAQEIDSLNYYRNQLRIDEIENNRTQFYQYLAAAYVYNNDHISAVSKRLMQGNMRLNRMVWNDMYRINFDCKTNLQSFNNPVLIIQGNQDIIPKELALTAHKVFPNSKLVFLEHCGHYGWLDKKEEYLKLIKNFLQEIYKH